jgi:peroxiredoxin
MVDCLRAAMQNEKMKCTTMAHCPWSAVMGSATVLSMPFPSQSTPACLNDTKEITARLMESPHLDVVGH